MLARCEATTWRAKAINPAKTHIYKYVIEQNRVVKLLLLYRVAAHEDVHAEGASDIT
jgi:hypothetical protein